MKIDGTKSSSETSGSKKTEKKSSGGGVFKSMMGDDGASSSVSQTGASGYIAAVDALLIAQATEDPAQKKSQKRMVERADSILDKLNDLKMALLTGQVTIGHMLSIADVVATHRERITDPDMAALLDEID